MPEQLGFRCMIPEFETYTVVSSVTASGVAEGAVVGTAVAVGIAVAVSVGVAAGIGVGVGMAVAVATGVDVGVGIAVGFCVAVGFGVPAGVGTSVGIVVGDGMNSVGDGAGVGAGVSAPPFDRESPPRSSPAATVRTETPSRRRLSHAAFGSKSSDAMSAAAPRTHTKPPSTILSPFVIFLHCTNSVRLLQSRLAFSFRLFYTLFVIHVYRRSDTVRSSSEYRRIARARLSGNWGVAIAASLIAGLLGAGGSSIQIPSVDLSSFTEVFPLSEYLPHFSLDEGLSVPVLSGVFVVLLGLLAVLAVIGIVLAVIGSAMDLGRCKFFVRLVHGERSDLGVLFHYFRHLGNAFVLRLLMNIFIFLWTLLFIIPGIIAAYSYSMAPYLMAKDPTLSPMAAIRMSKELMRGKKMDLFILQLSFIGWSILCLFTCGIGYIFLTPYTQTAEAAFALDCLGLGADLPGDGAQNPAGPPPDINTVFDE